MRRLSNRFILTANIEAKDGGKEIAHGNGKVVRARLSDALYFWRTDQGDLPDLDQLEASARKIRPEARSVRQACRSTSAWPGSIISA